MKVQVNSLLHPGALPKMEVGICFKTHLNGYRRKNPSTTGSRVQAGRAQRIGLWLTTRDGSACCHEVHLMECIASNGSAPVILATGNSQITFENAH